ncbi:alanine acetyltransferase [Kitasatospora xanthocidica]|uniref:GNAT family N-acetyltransferase n=1 Tax=Kitasatospora xanthocidica TaxID=83382 RepID=UPI00167237D9|nr:GNAT family protein [Kitasatospora xanthocidica]GHF41040.1 alanine acetyltransferase [Kitasatospora xanthocidica]
MTDEPIALSPIALSPIAETDLPQLDALVAGPEQLAPFQWFGWRDPGRFRRIWAENGLFSDEQSALAVRAGGEFAGFVSWRRVNAGPNTSYWNIGIQLRAELCGRGLGTEAQRQLARYLFAHTTVMRLEADTEVTNVAEQRALEKAGFTREGVRRGATFRDGEWRDGVVYSLLRTDPKP